MTLMALENPMVLESMEAAMQRRRGSSGKAAEILAMASTQSLANRQHRESAARNGPMPPDAVIEWNEIHWTPLTAEPRGVDYIEANAIDRVGAAEAGPVRRRNEGNRGRRRSLTRRD